MNKIFLAFLLLATISCTKNPTQSTSVAVGDNYLLELQNLKGTISNTGLSFDGLDVNFGEVLPKTKVSQKITLINNLSTNQPLTISSTIASPLVLTKTCGSSLAAKRSCVLTISGTINNEKDVVQSITINDQLISVQVTSGTIPELPAGTSNIASSPSAISLGMVAQNSQQIAQITLTNTGSAVGPLSVPVLQNFIQTSSSCGSTLASKRSCIVKYSFNSTGKSGLISENLLVNGLTIPFSAEIESAPAIPQIISVTPSTTSIVDSIVSPAKSAHKITFTNLSSKSITNISILNQAPFVISGTNCSGNLAANRNCYVSVTINSQGLNSGSYTNNLQLSFAEGLSQVSTVSISVSSTNSNVCTTANSGIVDAIAVSGTVPNCVATMCNSPKVPANGLCAALPQFTPSLAVDYNIPGNIKCALSTQNGSKLIIKKDVFDPPSDGNSGQEILSIEYCDTARMYLDDPFQFFENALEVPIGPDYMCWNSEYKYGVVISNEDRNNGENCSMLKFTSQSTNFEMMGKISSNPIELYTIQDKIVFKDSDSDYYAKSLTNYFENPIFIGKNLNSFQMAVDAQYFLYAKYNYNLLTSELYSYNSSTNENKFEAFNCGQCTVSINKIKNGKIIIASRNQNLMTYYSFSNGVISPPFATGTLSELEENVRDGVMISESEFIFSNNNTQSIVKINQVSGVKSSFNLPIIAGETLASPRYVSHLIYVNESEIYVSIKHYNSQKQIIYSLNPNSGVYSLVYEFQNTYRDILVSSAGLYLIEQKINDQMQVRFLKNNVVTLINSDIPLNTTMFAMNKLNGNLMYAMYGEIKILNSQGVIVKTIQNSELISNEGLSNPDSVKSNLIIGEYEYRYTSGGIMAMDQYNNIFFIQLDGNFGEQIMSKYLNNIIIPFQPSFGFNGIGVYKIDVSI